MGVSFDSLKHLLCNVSVLRKPWREINWRDKQSDLQSVKDYRPQTDGQLLRILLHGPVGAGKSSFINSVQSILHGRMYAQALADNTSHDLVVVTFYPFVFNDIMGLSPTGVQVDDVKLALKGHVKDDYRFNRDSRLSEDDPFYNNHPTDNDKVHVLVCVIDANTVTFMQQEVEEKIRQIRIEATHLSIPQVAILTKIDEACPEIKEDLKNVYKVNYLKEKMEEFKINLNSDVDSLILKNLAILRQR
uniref:G domain-containing protein n=1 Tax=Sander lucioperca TaxID=283035 RepID=A0A8D0D1A9_SANLU